MTGENHIPEDDLVLFALQLLPQDRMREARQHLQGCDECRAEIARLQGDLVAYALTAESQAPPAAARERLLRQIAKEPRPVPAAAPVAAAVEVRPRTEARARTDARSGTETPMRDSEPMFSARQSRSLSSEGKQEHRPRRAAWVLAGTGWAVAAGCSFVAGLQMHQRQQVQNALTEQQARLEQTTRDAAHAQDALAALTASNAKQVALHLLPVAGSKTGAAASAASTSTAPEAVAAYLADKGALVFVATHLQPVASGKTYELWLLPANGNSPIPAGTFKPDAQGSASVVLPELPKGVPAKGFGVTVENDGGSGTPTLPIVMAGT
jgi:anti-sigma-K factor RskA